MCLYCMLLAEYLIFTGTEWYLWYQEKVFHLNEIHSYLQMISGFLASLFLPFLCAHKNQKTSHDWPWPRVIVVLSLSVLCRCLHCMEQQKGFPQQNRAEHLQIWQFVFASAVVCSSQRRKVNTPVSSFGTLSVLLKDVWSSPGDTEPIQQIFEHIASARGWSGRWAGLQLMLSRISRLMPFPCCTSGAGCSCWGWRHHKETRFQYCWKNSLGSVSPVPKLCFFQTDIMSSLLPIIHVLCCICTDIDTSATKETYI